MRWSLEFLRKKLIHNVATSLYIEEFGFEADASLTSTLEKSYIYQYFIDKSFDYEHNALIILLNRRRSFWNDFLSAHYDEDGFLMHTFRPLSAIWLQADCYELVEKGLQLVSENNIYGIRTYEVKGFFEGIDQHNAEKVEHFVERFIRENSNNVDLLNAIYLALSDTNLPAGKKFIVIFLTYNQSEDDFTGIDWMQSSEVSINAYETITGDHKARHWENILEKVESMDNPMKYLRHKQYIETMISHELEHATYQRRKVFLGRR